MNSVPSGLRALVAATVCAVSFASATPAYSAGDPRLAEQWGLSIIRAPEAWGAGTGAGITIAVVDTGVDFGHQDLNVGGKLLAGRNILDPNSTAQDDHGHGTHVAGIAAAAAGNGIGIAGTAPDAFILPVKVLDEEGRGYARDVATGIRWAAGEGAPSPRAHVINLSLGSDLPPLASLLGSGLEEAVGYAWSRGVVVVLAAGNSFLFASSSGNTPAVVVTATTRQDQLAGYASAVGSAKWGMAAPGGTAADNAGGIMSTYLPNDYRFLAGTSMAAPYVAGAAAVLRGQGFSPQQTVDRLLATAKDLGSAGRDSTFGAGRLDMACAVGRCGAAPVPTSTPAAGGSQPSDEGGTPAQPPAGSSDAGGSAAGSSAGPAEPAPATSGGSSRSSASGSRTGSSRSSVPRSSGPAAAAGSTTGGSGTSPAPAPGEAPLAGEAAPGAGPVPPEAPAEVGTDADEIGLFSPLDDAGSEENQPSPLLVGMAAALLVLSSYYGWRRRPTRR